MKKALLAIGVCLLAPAGAGLAGRPLTIDDAEPIEPMQLQFEAGICYWRDPGCDHLDAPLGLTCGLVPGLEVGIGFGGQFEERTEIEEETVRENSVGDLSLGAKWKVLDEDGWLPAQALAPAVKFPTADRDKDLGTGKADYDLSWIASKSLSDEAALHVNLGYTWIGSPDDEHLGDLLHYGIAGDYLLLPELQWVGEIFSSNELKRGVAAVWMGNTGLRWEAAEGLTLDAAAGTVIHGDAPDLTATAGLTWVFGLNGSDGSPKEE